MWDKRYGGNNQEVLTSFRQTSDGGFILSGSSNSGVSGDKTQALQGGLSDYWIVKIDSMGNKQWDKDFGGIGNDALHSIQQTADHGYILGGLSNSTISGDKTQDTIGSFDYWIVKTDSIGNKEWDKTFGGIALDYLYSIQQTTDVGYILGGYTPSGVGGDKTQPSWGSNDFWIVKIDSSGNKQWDKDFGGIGMDNFHSLQQTIDGGYILGGGSGSGIGGDKTQPLWGTFDYWIIKIDAVGSKQWDKDFGGTGYDELLSLQETVDGGYILGGFSLSGIGGDKTGPTWGNYDYWIVKSDSICNKQWDKDFGADSIEGGNSTPSITQTSDGGYLLAGTSFSPISGDKTENNLGPEQTWVVKTDSLGNKLWDKTIFTPGQDQTGLAIQTRDGCYVIANYTSANIGGYKTQSGRGGWDFWIVKFCDSTFIPPTAATTANQGLCPGTCTTFLNLSFNSTTYQWSFPGASPDTSTDLNPSSICYPNPGNYDVQLIATNANGSDTLLLTNYITVYPTPPPQAISQSGDTLFAITGTGTYQWYFNNNIINGATNYFYVAQTSGDYNVVCTDSNGCEVEAAIQNVIAGLTLTLSKGEGINLYPNPVTDKMTIHYSQATSETAVEISIYNVIGVLVIKPQTLSLKTETVIDVSQLPDGMYLLEAYSDIKVLRVKFVKSTYRQ